MQRVFKDQRQTCSDSYTTKAANITIYLAVDG